ncbi:hypothetical protein JZ751_027585 [Albula glossodonta]|uniref:Aftiphilin clathrin-binding box domain-containing protein n=1 Tax=Albula glossodonta TaxID=121402 RepID=A0A8T2NCR2_9TELE|nr:hypothetical protein JZ751_027585 [Albula glossodonta]
MEPDVIRMYSSSPPPLDDGAEEDDDDFGDFGAFSGVPSSVSFTEFDTPSAFGQSQTATAADTSPPNHFTELGPGPLGRVPKEGDLQTFNSDAQGVDSSGSRESRPLAKTVSVEELKKPVDQTRTGSHLNTSGLGADGSRTEVETHSCNGGLTASEVLTNGFAAFDGQDGPPCPAFDHRKNKGTTSPMPDHSPPNTEDEFDDFSAFGTADTARDAGVLGVKANREESDEGKQLSDGFGNLQSESEEVGRSSEENGLRDSHSTGLDPCDLPAVVMDTLSNGDRGSLTDEEESEQRDGDSGTALPDSAAMDPSGEPVVQNGDKQAVGEEEEEEEFGECEGEGMLSMGSEDAGAWVCRSGKGMEIENDAGVSVSESFASFCQAVSPDGEEEFGDFSAPGLAPSACPEEETLTPADPSWPTEEEEEEEEEAEDFGDFGEPSTFSSQGFADFEQTESQQAESEQPSGAAKSAKGPGDDDEGDFGDFSAPREGGEGADGGGFEDFPVSDSFADFSSAPTGSGPDDGSGWSAFEDQQTGEGDSWAAFGEEQSAVPSVSEERLQDSAPITAPSSGSPKANRRDSLSVSSASLASRLERLFCASFPEVTVPEAGEEVVSLKARLEPPAPPQGSSEEEQEEDTPSTHWDSAAVWRQLLEIHDALGLRYQWGGSHSNKALLCSLGIDTRNILFTGQKKQPVIVPMYAASLGMLEPTKEPVKPISAAEKIASIAQAPPVSPEISTSPDPSQVQTPRITGSAFLQMQAQTTQEALPPVQFDWSSSGLTNPLDGVDPELYELTTAKMDTSNTSSRIADAFARLMSTVEKTSTSTRKPKKEEVLSEEAAKVIAGLPDLSFMQAKVLMFPTTLTPLGCTAPTPE